MMSRANLKKHLLVLGALIFVVVGCIWCKSYKTATYQEVIALQVEVIDKIHEESDKTYVLSSTGYKWGDTGESYIVCFQTEQGDLIKLESEEYYDFYEKKDITSLYKIVSYTKKGEAYNVSYIPSEFYNE